jgi:hypothetical protein
MENQTIDLVQNLFVKVISYNRLGLVDALNNNGFPITPNDDEDTLIKTSLNALEVSPSFRDDLVELMANFSDNTANYKSFAPYQNDLTESLAPQQIMGNEKKPDDIFYNAPLFAK